jgi:hypothetical protein
MPGSTTNSIASNHLPHCSHRTQQGKRCRLPALDANRGLCFRHAGLHAQEADSGDLSADLLAELDNLQSAQQVNLFLSRLLEVLTKNRIATKRAAVLTYICAQILRTMPAIERELKPAADEPQQIVIDIPRPSRD